MDAIQQRANEIDLLAKDLQATLTQIKGSNLNINQKNASSQQSLSQADSKQILQKLKSVKSKIQTYEAERIREKRDFTKAMEYTKEELLAIKKEIMVKNFQSQPQDFRNRLKENLQKLRKEIVDLDNKQKQQQSTAAVSGDGREILNKVKSELIQIRKETAQKLQELDQYKVWYNEMESYKTGITQKLSTLRNEVQKYEQEMTKTKRELTRIEAENDDYRKGNLIPSALQEALVSKLSILKESVFQIETENKTFLMQNNDLFIKNISREYIVTTIDLHIGGHPLRIISSGIQIDGNNLSEKRENIKSDNDYYRKFLMYEPRGHFDGNGAIITDSDDKNAADFAVIFMDNTGYPIICGNALLGLGRYAVDFGKIKMDQNDEKKCDEIPVRIQCPCGIITVNVEVEKNAKTGNIVSTGNVSFSTNGSSVFLSENIHLDSFGKVEIDVCSVSDSLHYIICPATRFKYSVRDSPVIDLINIANLIKANSKKKFMNKLSGGASNSIYGIILTDAQDLSEANASCNICVFADGQIDRSPNINAIIARLSCEYAKKNIKLNQEKEFIGKTSSTFSGKVVKENNNNSVTVNITGKANYIGRSTWCLESGDNIGKGFLLK